MNTSTFDIVDYLDNETTIAAYLSAVLEEGNSDLLLAALSDVARARGMASLAAETGLSRESLYKALRPGAKPRYETVAKILGALRIKLQAVPV